MPNLGQNILFLDDDPDRCKQFKTRYPAATIVTTAADCIYMLQRVRYVTVSLDHDLEGEVYVNPNRKDCGMEVARWIVANKPKIDEILLHSHNAPAAALMQTTLKNAGYQAILSRFGEGKLWRK